MGLDKTLEELDEPRKKQLPILEEKEIIGKRSYIELGAIREFLHKIDIAFSTEVVFGVISNGDGRYLEVAPFCEEREFNISKNYRTNCNLADKFNINVVNIPLVSDKIKIIKLSIGSNSRGEIPQFSRVFIYDRPFKMVEEYYEAERRERG